LEADHPTNFAVIFARRFLALIELEGEVLTRSSKRMDLPEFAAIDFLANNEPFRSGRPMHKQGWKICRHLGRR
jgi:hypothetical protein